MDNYTISIFNNKIFFQIISEIKLFSKFKIKHYDNIDLCIKDAEKKNQIAVFFNYKQNKIKKNNFPTVLVHGSTFQKNIVLSEITSELIIPFTILEFEKKIILLIAKNEFKKNSLINLGDYVIDKNERKIKKNNLELQLSEKEINFLVLFSEKKEPLSKSIFLKNVWNYSPETETHTIKKHIHRLRKKILKKFDDDNFIKNNNKGYYI
jgi:hypothetical protein